MASIDDNVYGKIKIKDLFKEIHTNQYNKSKQIETLITTLTGMIQNLNDAAVVVPLIKEYLDISVKNDDMLVKLAAIVQKLYGSESKNKSLGDLNQLSLSAEEIKQLKDDISGMASLSKEIDATLKLPPSTK